MYESNRSSTQHYLKLFNSTGSSQHWLFERHCVHGNVWSTGWIVHRLCRILFWVMPQYLKIFKPPFKSLFFYFTWQKNPQHHRCRSTGVLKQTSRRYLRSFCHTICYLMALTYAINFCESRHAFFLHICAIPNMISPCPSFERIYFLIFLVSSWTCCHFMAGEVRHRWSTVQIIEYPLIVGMLIQAT